MNEHPKITLITVCYNSAATIKDTLQSVAEQTYDNFEYLVIDGASKDDTVALIKQYGSRVTKLISEPDRGIYDAMNKGIHLATGDVIGFLNADDFFASPEVLTKVAEVFANPDIDACYGDLCYVKQDDTSSIVRYWQSSSFKSGLFSQGWCPPHPTFYVRRSIYEQFGGFDLNYKRAADVELMMRFLEKHQINSQYLPITMVMMRLGGASNHSWNAIIKQNQEILQALRQHGLNTSLLKFIAGKIFSRGMQFLSGNSIKNITKK